MSKTTKFSTLINLSKTSYLTKVIENKFIKSAYLTLAILSITLIPSLNTFAATNASGEWEITIPKTVNLQNSQSNKNKFSGSIPITVKGDLNLAELLNVDTPNTVSIKNTRNNNTVQSNITLGKTKFLWKEINKTTPVSTSHTVTTTITPGNWTGTLNFNLNVDTAITLSATNTSGVDLNADTSVLSSNNKNSLLQLLEDQNILLDKSEVDIIVDSTSNSFSGKAISTLDFSTVKEYGSKVAILNYNNSTQKWSYLGTYELNSNGKTQVNMSNFGPLAFLLLASDEYFELPGEGGIYRHDNTQVATWRDTEAKITKTAEGEFEITELGNFTIEP